MYIYICPDRVYVCIFWYVHIHTYVYVFIPASAQLWQNTWTRLCLTYLPARNMDEVYAGEYDGLTEEDSWTNLSWWFQIFLSLGQWSNLTDPTWLTFFRWVETTNMTNAGNLKSYIVGTARWWRSRVNIPNRNNIIECMSFQKKWESECLSAQA